MSIQPSGKFDARTVHDHLRRALTTLHEAECNAVTLFAEILRRHLYRDLGFASIQIYAVQGLGFSRTKNYEFIRLAEALDKLPTLEAGLKTGELPWTKAREVVNVATPQSEKRWIEIARNSSRRELERQVVRSRALRDSGKRDSDQRELVMKHEYPKPKPAPGQTKPRTEPHPERSEPPEAAPVRGVSLRLEPLQRARFDALVEKLMKRHRRGRGEIVLMALDNLLCGGENSNPRAEVDSLMQSNQLAKAPSPTESNRVAMVKPGARPAETGQSPRGDCGTPYQVVVYQCDSCKTTTVGPERTPLSAAAEAQVACDSRILEPGKRNRSTIPPARRRAVLQRDGYRCRVQGCDSTSFLEVHHLKRRSQGGGNSSNNLLVLCSSCHRHLHQRGGVTPPLRDP